MYNSVADKCSDSKKRESVHFQVTVVEQKTSEFIDNRSR